MLTKDCLAAQLEHVTLKTPAERASYLLCQPMQVKTTVIDTKTVGQVFAGATALPIYSNGTASNENLIELARGWLKSLCAKEVA